jgi:hypothetical protein
LVFRRGARIDETRHDKGEGQTNYYRDAHSPNIDLRWATRPTKADAGRSRPAQGKWSLQRADRSTAKGSEDVLQNTSAPVTPGLVLAESWGNEERDIGGAEQLFGPMPGAYRRPGSQIP